MNKKEICFEIEKKKKKKSARRLIGWRRRDRRYSEFGFRFEFLYFASWILLLKS